MALAVRYRQAVAAVIRNDQGKFFIGHSPKGDQWQFPQGGLLPEETPQQALLREIEEELGLSGLQIVANLGEYQYDWDPAKKQYHDDVMGQQMVFFLLQFHGSSDTIRLDGREFDDYAWFSLVDFPWDRFTSEKLDMYRQIALQLDKQVG